MAPLITRKKVGPDLGHGCVSKVLTNYYIGIAVDVLLTADGCGSEHVVRKITVIAWAWTRPGIDLIDQWDNFSWLVPHLAVILYQSRLR